ncbi:MAG: lasso peptide biosynthesis B2 protein [Minwuia sp.]|nr:lasso peptide biosynthesis B2 protein [Minwuia sp.]
MQMSLAQTIARKCRNLGRQPAFTIIWLFPVWLLLGLYRALILSVPLKRMAPFYGQDVGASAWVPLTGDRQTSRARQIRRTIALAVRYCPWDANCYPQALAARTLLRFYRVPHAIYFGLERAKGARDLSAHAWVMSGPISVTGGQAFAHYHVVRMFVGRGLAPEGKA